MVKHIYIYYSVYIPLADGTLLPEYKSVRNKLFIKVDFPKPDSPKNKINIFFKKVIITHIR